METEKEKKYESEIPLSRGDLSQQLEQLKKAQNAEARVRMFADIMDKKGLDAVLGLVPGLGDGALALIATAYLLLEAKVAKVPPRDMWNITKQQALDFGIGAIPVIGDIADFFNKSHTKSLGYFTKRTQELEAQAKNHGATQEELEAIKQGSEKIRSLLEKAKTIADNKYIRAHVKDSLTKISSLLQKN